MKIRKSIALLSALGLLAYVLPASAQTNLTCDDITFNYELTSKFPDIADHCIKVVEVDGQRVAKFSVEIVRIRNNGTTFRFKDPDDGKYGPTQSVDLAHTWRANIGGQEYRISELSTGQEMNIYLPADRWEAHVARSTTAVFAVYSPVPMVDDDGGSGAMLPSTAGFMPLFALFGGAALFSAFMIRIFRRR